MSLILPPHVQRRIDIEKRIERDRRILRCCTMDDPRCQEFTTKLKLRYPDAWMTRAYDTVDADLPLWPGFYHILQVNKDAGMTVMPVHSNGAYVEPDDSIFDHLARMNLRERRVRERLAQVEREEREAGERELAEANENRKERLQEIVKSATRAQISMDRTIPWTQNSQGRRPK